jgi:hypothetical protein
MQRIELDPNTGKINIFPGVGAVEEHNEPNPWNEVLTDAQKRSA